MLEKDIENQILQYLEVLNGAHFWKVNTTGVWSEKRGRFLQRSSKYRYKGIPDIIGFYRGKFVAIEVKTPKRRDQTTEDQKFFIDKAIENNQIAFVATSIDDVIDALSVMEVTGERDNS